MTEPFPRGWRSVRATERRSVNLAQLCREAAAYAADMGQLSWARALEAAAEAAEAMGEWEADQLDVDVAATTLEYLAGVA